MSLRIHQSPRQLKVSCRDSSDPPGYTSLHSFLLSSQEFPEASTGTAPHIPDPLRISGRLGKFSLLSKKRLRHATFQLRQAAFAAIPYTSTSTVCNQR